MMLHEWEFEIPPAPGNRGLITHIQDALKFQRADGRIPLRFAITRSDAAHYHCEVGALERADLPIQQQPESIFGFARRALERTDAFNAVLVIPTGIGAEIGGHAGDGTPVARLLAEVCDTVILHPNVVNASDLNEMPENALYVEGSVLSRLLMGTIGLQRVRSNRVLVIIDAHDDELFVNAANNAVNAARSTFGLQCPRIIRVDPPVRMESIYTSSGRAAGRITGFDRIMSALEANEGQFDAVALSSVISVPHEYHSLYFDLGGEMVNPWGGVEALLTHAISNIYNVPSAHSPMFESRNIANVDPGVVDSRMAAEAISLTFLQCVLKGLQRSPRILKDAALINSPGVLSAADVSCLVIPDGCVGLPTLAALEQSIPVIAVRENTNLMRNDLSALPWRDGQLQIVDSYWEAVGVIAALKAGLCPASVRRPLRTVRNEIAGVELRDNDNSAPIRAVPNAAAN